MRKADLNGWFVGSVSGDAQYEQDSDKDSRIAIYGLFEVVSVFVDHAEIVECLATERTEVDGQLVADDGCRA